MFALAKRYDSANPTELAARLETSDDPPVHQAAYRQLVRTPEWREAVYAVLPGDLRGSVRDNVTAGEELRKLTAPREELPPWKIVAPPPADELRELYDAASTEFGVDWTYLAAIHLVETRMGRIRGLSTAGAEGPMQFLPSTWEHYGEGDINDPKDAIRAAARYLVAHGAPSNMDNALFAYNHSDHYVTAVKLYAKQMRSREAAYEAFHAWDVYYRTTKGDALLYVGWANT
ncbi:MAG: lytic transglycosylase domain-containing protein [Actinomycetota bacterium]